MSNPATLSVVPDISIATPVLTDPLTITLSFDEQLTPEAIVPGNFSVIHQGRPVPIAAAALSPDGRTVTLNLSSPISTGFTVAVGSEVVPSSGNFSFNGGIAIAKSPLTAKRSVFIDFGAADLLTTVDGMRIWNNVTPTIGTTNNGALNLIVGDDGAATALRLQMIRRFNNPNSSGSTTARIFPSTVVRDSLYGNAETFNNLTNVFPAFRITGLQPAETYTLTFYASRTATDNRTALYTVTGDKVSSAKLNASGNLNTTAVLADLKPASDGTLKIEISPAPENDNANHFIYLGALVISPGTPAMLHPVMVFDHLLLDWQGTGRLESSSDLQSPWTPVIPPPSPPFAVPQFGTTRFYRLSYDAPWLYD